MVWRANKKPVQAAFRSKQGMSSGKPRAAWSPQAAEGTRVSGVTVATMQAPIWSGGTPASSRARRAASAVMEEKVSSPAQWRRVWMPVRLAIHSPLVSTIRSRSWLVTSLPGTLRPVPRILIPFMVPPPRPSF